jgi:hypothetical protein
MNFGLIATVAGLVLGVIGVLPVLVAGAGSMLALRRAARLLGFGRKTPLDVVLSTSGFALHPAGTSASFRTNAGEVQGLGSVARALGRYYQGKHLRVHMSADVRNLLDGDVVVLGGPVMNDTAREFMDTFARTYGAHLDYDAAAQRLEIGDYSQAGYDLGRKRGVPAQDLVLILLARDLFTGRPSRDVLCAGFTTYGTAAAAELLFSDLTSARSTTTARRVHGRGGAALVAEVHLVNGQVTRWEVVHTQRFGATHAPPAGAR